jgi:hypothetical protein
MPSSDTIVSYTYKKTKSFVCSVEHAKWVAVVTTHHTNVQSCGAPSTLALSVYFCSVLQSEYKINVVI